MLWLKSFHIIAVVTWFAGIFYLPRLFVYHTQTSDQEGQDRFVVMEQKLFRMIMTPSAIVAVGCGIALVMYNLSGYLASNWFLLKFVLVLLLIGYNVYCATLMKQFAQRSGIKTEKFYRVFNELPVLLLISIILLVVIRPF